MVFNCINGLEEVEHIFDSFSVSLGEFFSMASFFFFLFFSLLLFDVVEDEWVSLKKSNSGGKSVEVDFVVLFPFEVFLVNSSFADAWHTEKYRVF